MEMQTAIKAMQEARAALYAALDRLAMNDIEGEEAPYIEDCETALEMLNGALRSAGRP